MEMMKLNIQLFASNTSDDYKLTSSSGNYGYLKASFSESDAKSSTNTSVISVTATLTRKTGSWSAIGKTSLQIWWYDNNNNSAGTKVAEIAVPELAYGNTGNTATVSGTTTVTHKSDGSLKGYAKAVWEFGGTFQHTYKSGSVATAETTLTTIPRYLSVSSFGCSAKEETSLTYSWSVSDTASKVIAYCKGPGESTAASATVYNDSTGSKTGTFTIKANGNFNKTIQANSTYQVYIVATRKDSGLDTTSSTDSTTTYNYPYITGVNTSELLIGNSQVLNFYNPLGREVSANMTLDDKTILDFGKTKATSLTVTPNINSLYDSIPNKKIGSATYTCVHTNKTSTVTGTTYKCNEADCKPIFAANPIQYKEMGTTVTNLLGAENNQYLVQNHSEIGIKFNAATCQNNRKGSITGYRVTCSGAQIAEKNNYTAAPTDYTNFGVVTSTSITITLTATDSRGYSSNAVKFTVPADNIKAWSKPTVSLTAKRQNDFNEETDIVATVINWSDIIINGTNYNSKASKLRMVLKHNEGSALGSNPIEYVFNKGTDYNSSYTSASTLDVLDGSKVFFYQVQIEDAFGSSSYNYATALVNRGVPIAMIDGEKLGVGVNCFPDGKGLYIDGYRVPIIRYGTGNPSGGDNGDIYIKIS